jgi:hypothetical protein
MVHQTSNNSFTAKHHCLHCTAGFKANLRRVTLLHDVTRHLHYTSRSNRSQFMGTWSPPPVASPSRHPKVRAAVIFSVQLGGLGWAENEWRMENGCGIALRNWENMSRWFKVKLQSWQSKIHGFHKWLSILSYLRIFHLMLTGHMTTAKNSS